MERGVINISCVDLGDEGEKILVEKVSGMHGSFEVEALEIGDGRYLYTLEGECDDDVIVIERVVRMERGDGDYGVVEKVSSKVALRLYCECGSEMIEKKGSYGKFFGCRAYPVCKVTIPWDIYENVREKLIAGKVVDRELVVKKIEFNIRSRCYALNSWRFYEPELELVNGDEGIDLEKDERELMLENVEKKLIREEDIERIKKSERVDIVDMTVR
jgi:ssDNA-binding Zn-finger/Zn-ribbon topoisomerase 1